MRVENSKGECNFGQHEINFRYDDALRDRRRARASTRTAPRRSPPRRAWRSRSWRSSTSARATRATSTARSRSDGRRQRVRRATQRLFERFVAGQLACLRELTLLFAPHVNSYKRFVEGSFAPTAVAWGRDNRTCSMRVVGHGQGAAGREPAARRGRESLPRAGRDDRRRAARDRRGAAARARRSRATPTSPTSRACRTTCTTRATCSRTATVARDAFGQEVVDHYLNRARVELEAFEAAVTDWERFRGFERL